MTPEEIKAMMIELIKNKLQIAVDKDTHVYTNQTQIIITVLWDGKEIDSDTVTI